LLHFLQTRSAKQIRRGEQKNERKKRKREERKTQRTWEVFFHLFDYENLHRNEDTKKRKGDKHREKDSDVVTPRPPSSASTNTRGTRRQGEDEDIRRRLDERRQCRTKNQTVSRPGSRFSPFSVLHLHLKDLALCEGKLITFALCSACVSNSRMQPATLPNRVTGLDQ
jgi:hypothetical protein